MQTNVGLYSIPPQKVTTTAGVRFFENRLILSAMWTSAMANTDIPPNYLPATSYDLVNLYLAVQADEGYDAEFLGRESAEPVLSALRHSGRHHRATRKMTCKWASAGAGIVFKGGLRYHFGGA